MATLFTSELEEGMVTLNPLAEYPFPSYFKAKGSHLLSRCIFRCCSLNYSL